MVEIEFTEIDDEVKDFTPSRRREYWLNVSQWAKEGERSAQALLQYGHELLRVVVDSEWELAIACDDCGLWASMTRKIPKVRISHASAGGTLLKVVSCSPTAVRDIFRDQVTKRDAWDGYSGWQIDQPDITSREGEYLYFTKAKYRKGGHQYKKEREAANEAATEEQGS